MPAAALDGGTGISPRNKSAGGTTAAAVAEGLAGCDAAGSSGGGGPAQPTTTKTARVARGMGVARMVVHATPCLVSSTVSRQRIVRRAIRSTSRAPASSPRRIAAPLSSRRACRLRFAPTLRSGGSAGLGSPGDSSADPRQLREPCASRDGHRDRVGSIMVPACVGGLPLSVSRGVG